MLTGEQLRFVYKAAKAVEKTVLEELQRQGVGADEPASMALLKMAVDFSTIFTSDAFVAATRRRFAAAVPAGGNTDAPVEAKEEEEEGKGEEETTVDKEEELEDKDYYTKNQTR